MSLSAVRYLGGKNVNSSTGTGRWIASMLPIEDGYCEPCFGMGGVFLARPRVRREIINDRSSRIVNFWRVVRDRADELGDMLEKSLRYPPRDEYKWACTMLDSPNEIKAAYALLVILCSGYKPTAHPSGYSHVATLNSGKLPEWRHIIALHVRMKDVLVENMDAVRLVSEYVRSGVIYIDPPYGTDTDEYGETMDFGAMTEAVRDHPAKILISGYGDTWDHLGWERVERETFTPMTSGYADAESRRTEVAWANFTPANTQRGLFT